MEKIVTIIVDADGLIALVNIDDANHQQAIKISEMLTQENATLLVPITAVLEAITASKRVINNPDLARTLVNMCKTGSIPIIDVTADILPEAIKYFNPDGSKQDTMFDAVIAAMAKKYKATAIFSFDLWYKKQGFILTSELVKN